MANPAVAIEMMIEITAWAYNPLITIQMIPKKKAGHEKPSQVFSSKPLTGWNKTSPLNDIFSTRSPHYPTDFIVLSGFVQKQVRIDSNAN